MGRGFVCSLQKVLEILMTGCGRHWTTLWMSEDWIARRLAGLTGSENCSTCFKRSARGRRIIKYIYVISSISRKGIKKLLRAVQKIRDENAMELALGGNKEINSLPKWEPK